MGPDNESAELSTGRELEEVESVDIDDFDSGDISEGFDQLGVLVEVDNQRALSDSVSLASEFAVASSDASAVNNFLDVLECSDSLEEGNCISSFFVGLNPVLDNKRDLRHVVDSVSSGEHQWNDATGSDGGGCSVSLLLDVHSPVPSSPGSKGCEHATLSAHVAESTLSAPVRTTSSNSGNTSHGSTGSPRGCTMLHTGVHIHTMSLSSVSCDILVYETNNVRSDRSPENCGKSDVLVQDLVGVVDVKD